ncbi:hypothetical protein KCN56_16160 [Photobacterium galatheae]|uniref:hypothetical protein n=1 Tax=Photobacterium galatheae TaxID=1654360 RepID=UPI000A407BEF|nr:hypothetical protein [Photobacterium galatheae]MCM0150088.1 hypothetical protein [Photobacterium galatheae]
MKVTKAQLRKGITLSQKEGERYQHQLKQSSKTVAASIKQDRYTATLTRTMTDSPSIAIQWPGQCNPETLPEQTDVLVNDVTVKMKVSCDAENQVTTSLPESPEALQVLRQQFSRYAWTTIKLPQKKDEVKFWTVNFQESWDTFIQSPVFAY